jgi:nicotinate-nucleotide adenylyltransferase
MVKLAIKGNSRFIVDEREIQRADICYTFDTLTELRREFGAERPLYFLMGIDAFQGLSSWYRWKELFDLAHIIVSSRPGFSIEASESSLPKALNAETLDRIALDVSMIANHAQGKIFFQGITLMDISASCIRKCVHLRKSIRYLLPDAVLDYIQRNQLYQDGDANR